MGVLLCFKMQVFTSVLEMYKSSFSYIIYNRDMQFMIEHGNRVRQSGAGKERAERQRGEKEMNVNYGY